MRYLGRILLASFVAVFAAAALPALAAEQVLLLHFDQDYADTSGKKILPGRIDGIPDVPPLDTSVKKFGNASLRLDRNTPTAIGYALNTLPALGTQDFSIDFWIYPRWKNPEKDSDPSRGAFRTWNSAGEALFLTWYPYNKTLYPRFLLYKGGWASDLFVGFSLQLNNWNHVMIKRTKEGAGYQMYLGVNGSVYSRALPSQAFSLSWPDVLTFGYPSGFFGMLGGNIDEVRVTVGSSPFSGNANYYVQPQAPYKGVDDEALPVPPPSNVLPATVSPPQVETFPPVSTTVPTATTTTKTFYRPDGTPFYDYDFTGEGPEQQPVATRFYASDGAVKTGELSYGDGLLNRETYFAPDGKTTAESRLFYPTGKTFKEIIHRGGLERYNRYLDNGSLAYTHVFDFSTGNYDGVRTYTYDGNGNVTEDLLYYANDRYEKKISTYSGITLSQIETFTRVPKNGSSPDYFYTLSRFTNGKVSFERTTKADASSMRAFSIEDVSFSSSGVITRRESFDFVNDTMSLTTFTASGSKTQMSTWRQSTGLYLSRATYEYDSDGKLEKEKTIRFRNGLTIPPYDGYDITVYAPTGEKRETYFYTLYDSGLSTSLRPKSADMRRYDPATGDILARSVFTYADSVPLTVTSLKWYDKNGILLGEGVTYTELKPAKYLYYTSAGNIYAESEYVYENATDYVRRDYMVYGGTRLLKKAERFRFANPSMPSPQSSDTKLATVSEDKLAGTKTGDAVLTSLGITPSSISQSNEKDALYNLTKGILERYKQRLTSIGGGADKKYLRYAAYGDAARDFQNGLYAIEYHAWGASKGWNSDQQLTFEVGGSWIGTDGTNGEEFWGAYIIPGGGAKYDAATTAFIDMSDVTTVNRVLQQTSYTGLTTLPKRKEKWDSFRGSDTIVFNSAEGGKLYYWNVLANNGTGGYLSISERVKEDPSINLLLDRMLADFDKDGVDLRTLDAKTVLRKFYRYMYEKSLITYIGDAGDTNQLPSETLERGGGDCDDNAALTLSLAYNLLLRLEKYDEANRLGFVVGAADSNPLSTSNRGVGHAAAGYLDAGGTYYLMDGAPLYTGSAKQRPITELEALPALSGGSTKTTFVKAAEWNFAAEAFSLVNGGTTFFTSPLGASSFYKTGNLPQTAVENTSAHIGELDRYLEPFNWRIEAIAKRFIEFIPRMSEKSVNDLVEITHDYFRDLVSYKADSGDTWNLVSTTLGDAVKDGKVVGRAVGDGEDLAFAEASLLTRILYDHFLSQGTYAPLALEQARQRIVLVGKKDGTNAARLLVGLVLPTSDERYTRVRLIDPLADKIGPVQFYADLFDTAQYSFVVTKEGPVAISHTNWGALVLK